MLMMYVFISTPVNLWHHHHFSVDTENAKAFSLAVNTDEHQLSSTISPQENCTICSHHYSAYCETGLATVPVRQPGEPPSHIIYYAAKWYQTVVNILANKGPPRLV